MGTLLLPLAHSCSVVSLALSAPDVWSMKIQGVEKVGDICAIRVAADKDMIGPAVYRVGRGGGAQCLPRLARLRDRSLTRRKPLLAECLGRWARNQMSSVLILLCSTLSGVPEKGRRILSIIPLDASII